ncbi:General odorant-binding protein 72 [Pseudolycoriella hygida]|uniref:General odorant-binding protein 72 n=1 Tax=Pseudolycoriella hygida TaxID=35572 RepID=A0A9Q0MS43_9DIPT|nr:General odorant-binding protein 72 [Pseudolycoriella hygida]
MKHMLMVISMLFVSIYNSNQADISEAQFLKTLSVFNSICQTKLNIADEQIEEVKKHPESLPDDSKEKCFATCVLEMFNMVIDGKVPIDLASESIGHFLPDKINAVAQTALDTCRSSLDANVNIHCVVGYNMLKCLAKNELKFFLI